MKAILSLLLLPFASAVPILPGKPSFPRNPGELSAFIDIYNTFSSVAPIQSIPPSNARVSSATNLHPIYIQICLDPDWKNCRYAMKDANICFHLEAPFDRKVTSYIVSLGCCIFYDQRGCKGNPMFSALNRSHRLGRKSLQLCLAGNRLRTWDMTCEYDRVSTREEINQAK
ncbi:hypothetical protein FPQ18DRAFT_306950 [Pyronema domesticum]|nr:hypothetical protein FPQ18DRAFT_306950 [Pyronema domesticum]